MTVIENDSPKEFFEGPFEVSDLIPFTFPYADRTDVKVKIGDEAATYGVEYEVSAESPSSILVKVNIDDGVQVTVYRETPIDQQSSYPQNSKFRSEQVESDFDKICMIQQEQKETLTRCLRVPVENIVAFDGELPSPQEGKMLVWSDEGKIVNSPSTITEIEDSVNTAVSNAATALSSASGAVLTAESAEQKATTALNQSTTALNNSTTAVTSADSAVSTANSASADAASAVETATYASNKVDEFGEGIETVLEAAAQIEELEEAIDEALEAADTAEEAAAQATQAAEEAIQVLSTKQDVLVSGTNIKTVNSTSLLGSGNIDVGTVTSVNNVQPVDGDVTIAIPDVSNLADKDLSNLSSTGQGILDNKLNRQQVTNCLLEVPNRIQYTLIDGELTIKAGSVAIVPYGTTDLSSTINVGDTFINSGLKVYDTYWDSTNSKFFVWVELQNDVIRSSAAPAGNYEKSIYLTITDSHVAIGASNKTAAVSASSDSAVTLSNCIFYNTTQNLVKRKASGTVESIVVTFPLMIALKGDTYIIENAKQVFNGFGYIGGVRWADKGIKCLMPNGRNADGSLNNIEYTLNHLSVKDSVLNGNYTQHINGNIPGYADMLGQDLSYKLYYNAAENYNYFEGNIQQSCICGSISAESGVITSFMIQNTLNLNAMCDGQWINAATNMVDTTTTFSATTTYEYSLEGYLPNDGYNYEVIVTASGSTGSTSGNPAEIGVGSSFIDVTTNRVASSTTRTSSSVSWAWSGIIPIGVDRIIRIRQIGASSCTCHYFRCKAYRRIGTNS